MRHNTSSTFFPNMALACILIMLSISTFAQDKNKLQADKKKIEAEIKYTNKLLEETKNSKKTSLNQLVILNEKIQKRETLIKGINSEISNLEQSIDKKNREVKVLVNELEQLKEEYANLIYYAYKNRNSYDRLMFIFSSNDFNQAYRRLKYLQQYSHYRKTQAELIKKAQAELKVMLQELEDQRNQKIELAMEKEKEVNKLMEEKQEKDKTVDVLGKREKELISTISKREKEAEQLQDEIESIIAEELRAAAERAKNESPADDNSGLNVLDAADMALSADFVTNKGKLPWPAERGIISSTFGEHKHPVLKKVKTKNNGIDILTEQGGIARVIFGGNVVSVKTITNTNKAVIIRHGEFFTVYSNLIEVYVKRGDDVKTLQSIGLIYTDNSESKTELHFEIWKGKTMMDPLTWLLKN